MPKRFIYFLPDIAPEDVTPHTLLDAGIVDRFLDAGRPIPIIISPTDKGPDGQGKGSLIAPGQQPAAYADSQRWTQGQAGDGKPFWVGLEDFPPGPENLIRAITVIGPTLYLNDANYWRVPSVKRWDESQSRYLSNLPQTFVMENGQCTMSVHPDLRSIARIADRVTDAYDARAVVPLGQQFADATRLLSTNYRIGIEEAGLLGLFDEAAIVRVLMNCADLEGFVAHRARLMSQGLEQCQPSYDATQTF